MQVEQKNSHQLLEEVVQGKRRAYAWGVGYFFEACRFLHNIPLHAAVHTSPDMLGKTVHGLRVISPDSLQDLDPATSLIIGYSSQFRSQIEEYCKKIPSVPLMFYDDPAFLSGKRMQKIISSLRLAIESEILKPAQLRLINQSTAHFTASSKLNDLGAGYSFLSEFVNDVGLALTRQVHFIYHENIHGDIAEFGTCSGTTASFLASAMANAEYQPKARGHADEPSRKLHLFDSFQGLPAITNELDIRAGWREGEYKDKTEAELTAMVQQYLPADSVCTYPGWFKDTLASLPKDQKFSLVHVDCDIYESTIDILDYLFAHDHFSDGCTIFFDDWNCGAASPDLGERRAWSEMVEKYKVRFTDCGNYSAYGNKFIVHMKRHA
jgi:hypothetical protein